MAVRAVIFDMDGVLVQSEEIWNEVRRAVVREHGGRWHERATRDMIGMSSTEWSKYMHQELGVDLPPEQINDEVVRRVEARYRERLPLVEGAREAVERLAARWPLALASSANRPLIELVLELSGLARFFKATVSSEEVQHGKPAPDVYLEAARRLEVEPEACAAIEDSGNGLRSAKAAGTRVIAVPNPAFPPADEALALADAVAHSLWELTPDLVTEGR